MASTSTLVAELVAALGEDAVRCGEAIAPRYHSDWSGAVPVKPLALVRPVDTEGVVQALRICHAHRVPVVPQGGLSGLAGGAVPVAGGVALSLERMQAIEQVDPASATVTVQAGASLQSVQEAALAQGLELGVDFGARGTAQIGGLLATNAGGNGVVQYGMAREQVLGLEVVLADGTVMPMLRPMRKNNTGYDLKHWFIGSEGTLGVITRALLSLRPAPQARATALVALPDFSAAIALLRRLQADFPGTLAAFELMWADFFDTARGWCALASPLAQSHPFYALVDVTGADANALAEQLQDSLGLAMEAGHVDDAVVAQSQAQARALWRIREATAEFPTHMQPLNFDVSLPLDQMDAFANECVQALTARWPKQRSLRFGHLGDGNLHLTTDLSTLGDGMTLPEAERAVEAVVYGLLEKRGGSVSAEHGIGQHKKPYLHLSRSSSELDAMRAIKRALDPRNILNPGRVFDL
jgi:FAD/FMN-containing dehydrogenase